MLIEILLILSLSTLLVGLFYLPGIKTDLNFADEGYLWYGTLKVLEGEVPIRDFRAYDPGRYYWLALWMRALGRTLMSLRIGLLVTQIGALTAGLTAVYIATHEALPVILMGFALVAWMYPRHKQIDILFSITTPLMAVLLVENPVAAQYVLSGVYVGICLFFGLNHGIYAGAGLSLLILMMGFVGLGPALPDSVTWYATGLSLAALPILAFFIIVPRLFKVYWHQKISRILKRGMANLPLPIPWLWVSEHAQLAHLDKGGQWVVKGVFTLMPIIYVAAILALILGFVPATRQAWVMAAVACSGLFYCHHAFSRADLSHLAQSIAPFVMLLVLYWAEFSYGWVVMGGFIALSLRYIYWNHASWLRHRFKICALEKVNIGETNLWLQPSQARYLEAVYDLIKTHSKQGEPVLLLPNLVTLYPMLKRKPAIYDLFCIYPATQQEEAKMIKELLAQAVGFVLINNAPLDRREDLRFSRTHPGVWQFLRREFQPLQEEGMPREHYAFIKR